MFSFRQILLTLIFLVLPLSQSFALSLDPWGNNKSRFELVLDIKNNTYVLLDEEGEALIDGDFSIDQLEDGFHLTLNYAGGMFSPKIRISIGPLGPTSPAYREVQIDDILRIEKPRTSKEPLHYRRCGEGCWKIIDISSLSDKTKSILEFLDDSLGETKLRISSTEPTREPR